MNLSDREEIRHSVVREMAGKTSGPVQQPAAPSAEQPPAPTTQPKAGKPRAKRQKAQTSKNASDESQKLQRAYYFDVDVVKAIHMKSISEGISLSEAANAALRKGLATYLKILQVHEESDEEG